MESQLPTTTEDYQANVSQDINFSFIDKDNCCIEELKEEAPYKNSSSVEEFKEEQYNSNILDFKRSILQELTTTNFNSARHM